MNKNKNEPNEDIGPSLVKSIYDSNLTAIVEKFGDTTLKSILEDGLLSEVPIIQTMIGIRKTALTIRDWIFLEKVVKFLTDLQSISTDEKAKLKQKIEEDVNFQKRLGEMLILLLDRFDHMDKPRILARLFRGYLTGKINFNSFTRLSYAINKAFINDLHLLFENYINNDLLIKDMNFNVLENLYLCGLSEIIIWEDPGLEKYNAFDEIDKIGRGLDRTSDSPKQRLIYKINMYAMKLCEIVIGEERIEWHFS